jgi:hypothetical protein
MVGYAVVMYFNTKNKVKPWDELFADELYRGILYKP